MAPVVKQLKADTKALVKATLINSGVALGAATGLPGAEMVGGALARRISKLIGTGDYTVNNVKVNSLIKRGGDPAASFGKDSSAIRIRHREYLGEVVTGSVAGVFNNTSFPINPGMRQTFPYLSQIAANYEQYCFSGLVFEFVSSASPYVSGSSLGTVIATSEYNPSASPFASKFAMENSNLAISTRLDGNLMYGIECALGENAQNCYYVRQGSSSLPITTTDMASFQIATAPGASVPTNTPLGELWVTYDVTLKRPNLDLSRTGSAQSSGSTFAAATPLGTVQSGALASGICSDVAITAGNKISLPSLVSGDRFLVSLFYQVPGGGQIVLASPTLTSCALVNASTAMPNNPQSAPGTAITTSIYTNYDVVLQATGNSPSLTFNATTFTGTVSAVSIRVTILGNYPDLNNA